MAVPIQFTAVYDWLARRKDINSTEVLIIARILRFGRPGCYMSNATLANALGMDRTTLIRALKILIHKEWVAPLYPKRGERILYINEAMLDDMPLFANVRGCGISLETSLSSSGVLQQGSVETPPAGSSETPPALNRNRKQFLLEKIDETRAKREVDFLASVMKEREGKPTAEQFEDRRQKLIEQVEGLK